MVFNRSLLISVFFLFFGTVGTAQHQEKQSLQKILAELEHRFVIVFTYADANIATIYINPPPEKFNLPETLHYLQQNTALLFQQLNERFVTISKTKPESADICGIVNYSDTGETVAGASIHSGKSLSISNENGYFYLKGISDDTVHIRFIGYRPLDIPVREFVGHPCKKITLQPQFTALQAIFVSDFITEGIDKKLDGALSIQAESLGMLPGLTEPDVLQTIQTLPGIQSINETISDINVRGGTNDQNLILWDGIRMYHSGHFFGLISAFNPYLTKKVTLVKNGSSAAASDGVSSTIDIRTDDQVSETFSGGAGLNMINGDVLAKIPLSKKASLHLSGRRSLADVIKTPAYKQYFIRAFKDSDVTNSADADTLLHTNQKFRFYDTSAKLLYDITSKDKLRISFLNVKNEIEYQESAIMSNSNETKNSYLEQYNLGTGVSYSRLWNEKIRTSARFYLSTYKLGAINFDLRNDQRLTQENKVLDTGLKVDTRISLSDKVGLFGGYQFFETGVTNFDDINNPPFRRSVRKVLRCHAGFLEADFTFGHTNMRMGIRSNYLADFRRVIIEPRFAFNQNFLKNMYLEILGEMNHQTSAQIIDLQSDFLGVEKRRWVLSNDSDIPIITSKQLSAGTYYKKNNLLISVEGYYKQVNGITTSSQGFQNQFQFIRASGGYETIGIDFLTSKTFSQFTTWFSYSRTESTFEFVQLDPSSFPNNLDIRDRATFGCTYQAKNIGLSTGLNWHSGKPFTEPVKAKEIVNNKINYTAPNTSRLPDYLRIDFSVTYRFPIGGRANGRLGASIWNLLNRENVVNKYFYINDDGQLESLHQSALKITPNMIFRIDF